MSNTVYTVTNTVTGGIYIGFTTQDLKKRWRQHSDNVKTVGKYFAAALKKYGNAAFLREVYGVFSSKEEAIAMECELIWLVRDMGIPCYNLTSGGEHFQHSEQSKARMRGRIVSPETRALIAASRKGKSLSETTRQKLRESMTGHEFSDEFRAKMSKIMMGNKNGANAPRNKGYKHTEEALRAISQASIQMWKDRRSA